MKCKLERIKQNLESLAGFNQTPGQGCTRLSYTEEFKKASLYLKNEMLSAGLSVREDAAGNLIGRYPGKTDGPVLMTGSHFDTVPHGGSFDGQAGICAALEALRVMRENHIVPACPIEIAAMPEEEGSRFGGGLFGSQTLCFPHTPEELREIKDSDGVTLYQALRDYGLNPDEIGEVCRETGAVAAFIELHIEQGPVLEQHQKVIGIVDAIVGLENFEISIFGRADHAGTTPMDMRADALSAAAGAISAATETASSLLDGTVVTFGRIQSLPASANIVPSQVKLTADCRSSNPVSIQTVMQTFRQHLESECRRCPDLSYQIKQTLKAAPAMMHPQLKQWIEESSNDLGLSSMHLLSGAGHDSMNFARRCPVAMIFVPSKGGRSHCPEEWTDYRQVTDGADVLLNTLLKAAEGLAGGLS